MLIMVSTPTPYSPDSSTMLGWDSQYSADCSIGGGGGTGLFATGLGASLQPKKRKVERMMYVFFTVASIRVRLITFHTLAVSCGCSLTHRYGPYFMGATAHGCTVAATVIHHALAIGAQIHCCGSGGRYVGSRMVMGGSWGGGCRAH
jgi:hypothetical protein